MKNTKLRINLYYLNMRRLWYKIKDSYYDVKWGIRNLISWFPLAWSDRYYDFNYTYRAILFKIEQQKKWWIRNERHVDWEKDVERMNICIEILNNLINDSYETNAYNEHNEKWGEAELTTSPGHMEGYVQLHINHPKAVTVEDQKLEGDEFRSKMQTAREFELAERKKLFMILAEHGPEWWD
jgi:hypothetical protein